VHRHTTGIGVDAIVHREGAVPVAPGRRAHRRRRSSPQLELLAAAGAVVAVLAVGVSTLVQMSGEVTPDGTAPVPSVTEEQVARQLTTLPSDPPAPAGDAEPLIASAEEIAALPSSAVPTPRPTRKADPTEQPRSTRSQERAPLLRTEDLDLTEEIDELEIDGLSAQLMKGLESSVSRGRKHGRLRGWRG
jgi:hypothetical protein